MLDVSELRGLIAKKQLSQSKVAKLLGITPNTFYLKMRKGVFTSTELEAMIELLDISNPCDIFFKKRVAQQGTNDIA